MAKQSYYVERNIKTTNKLREILNEFPDFAIDYFVGIEPRTSALTRLNYAYDLRTFFNWAFSETDIFEDKKRFFDLEVKDLERFEPSDFERYLSFVSTYQTSDGNIVTNSSLGKARKLSVLRSFFKYYFKRDLICVDNASKIDTPKIYEKPITRFDDDEIKKFLSTVENGYGLAGHEQGYHKHTKIRDTAITTLLLGTGIRVSECVGLNVSDVDLKNKSISITRKGGNESIIYFSDEVKDALLDWINYRGLNDKLANEPALFISLQNKRICARAVEKLVKKYAGIVTPLKHITPHKLRSTYGTKLYHATGDIYMVADVLGHKDVNTTKKHYAAITEDIRKKAGDVVSLRK